jgi:ribosomal protein S18 acetylase RimI-like enzyme
VAFRQHDATSAEMKRLYVRPQFRGLGLGRQLVNLVLAKCAGCGYRRIVLDTLPSMAEAIGLYRQMGFEAIDPYYENPVQGALFLAKELNRR